MNIGCNSSGFGRAVAVRQQNISTSHTMNAFLQHINGIINHSMPIILKLTGQSHSHVKYGKYSKLDPELQRDFLTVENLA